MAKNGKNFGNGQDAQSSSSSDALKEEFKVFLRKGIKFSYALPSSRNGFYD